MTEREEERGREWKREREREREIEREREREREREIERERERERCKSCKKVILVRYFTTAENLLKRVKVKSIFLLQFYIFLIYNYMLYNSSYNSSYNSNKLCKIFNEF